MELAKRDLIINNINSEIAYKKKDLFNKVNELQVVAKENKFLEEVIKDYKRYYNYINEEKLQQYRALEMIYNYIDRISEDTDITDEILEQTKYDQQELLKEMNNIKQELDMLISN